MTHEAHVAAELERTKDFRRRTADVDMSRAWALNGFSLGRIILAAPDDDAELEDLEDEFDDAVSAMRDALFGD